MFLMLTCVLLILAPAHSIAGQTVPEPGVSGTLTTLQRTAIPARDPIDLGKRLLGIAELPATPSKPEEYQVGDIETFSAEDNDQTQTFTVTARLWYKSPHVYMWFQSDFTPDLAAVQYSGDVFENETYPTVHRYFGSEASPGIDNDIHLYIVHARGLGNSVGGYYDSSSGYSKAIMPSSNEQQVFFINLDTTSGEIGSRGYDAILAHEFQHMVHDNVDHNEDGWLNEGLSMLSEYLIGTPDMGVMLSFLGRPETQLNTWSIDGDNTAHYGASFAFTNYFLQRFGQDALKRLVANPDNGLESFRSTLKQIYAVDSVTHKSISVEDFFADWTMANLLNDPKAGNGRYAYTGLADSFKTLPTMDKIVPHTNMTASDEPQTATTSQWGTVYLDIDKPGSYHFSFKGQPTVKIVPTEPHSEKMMWWGNRADQSDTRLTHTFDLSNVKKATLSFWLWHTIEKDWDYGYVMVSTDEGKTWKSLSTEDSTPAGGHNNPYGPAYTGVSGGKDSSKDAIWEHENLDLTPYAGQKIMLRFEYVTDDATTGEGMLLDDISIPEINYSTDAEADDGGWKAEGWVRIENSLPQRFLVQEAVFGKSTSVSRLLGPSDGTSGQWTINVGDDVKQVMISVSGLTEFTTASAPFTYTLASMTDGR
jgi:hypothetical protein